MVDFFKILIFVLISNNLNSQIIDLSKEVQWERIENYLSEKDKIDLVNDLSNDLIYYLKDNKILESNIKNFHFFDLNGDTKLDFIYTGYAGGEQESTLIFLQRENGNLERVFEVSGIIYGINNLTFSNNTFSISIVKNDSCFDCYEVYNLTTFIGIKGVFKEVANFNFTGETEIPDEMFRKSFKTTDTLSFLRSRPSVNDIGEDFNFLFGNVIAEFKTSSKVIALARKKDESNQIWWFVGIEAEKSDKAIFEIKKGYHLGWISNKDLDKIVPFP